eukprot:TRINITY_DN7311_c0_g1_i1.p1 TRINITY_DN7311_c0_g1~~TRINITY_DN7311_c0_g1_i1.p1  ORF type:complete len:352 (+),score=49.89 TRINITY_DN7311_c0_g1_i1:93-1148(+)
MNGALSGANKRVLSAGDEDEMTAKRRKPEAASVELRVMCFNILADWAAVDYTNELYTYAAREDRPWVLNWKRRFECIKDEINKWAPAVLAVQEADPVEEVADFLKSENYQVEYVTKTKHTKHDSVLLAWRSNLLDLKRAERVYMSEAPPKLSKPQVGLLLEFQLRGTGRRLLVSTTHIYFAPKAGDVKKYQIDVMLQRVTAFLNGWSVGEPLRTGGPIMPLMSGFKMVHNREPVWTNSHATFRDTVDYIWLAGLTPVAAPCPTREMQERIVGIPSPDFGSDHVPIVLDVKVDVTPGSSAIFMGDFNMTPRSELYRYINTARAPGKNLKAWAAMSSQRRPFRNMTLFPGPLV